MSALGVFAVDRGVFDHPIFANEPFSEREAWLWMVANAAWKPARARVGRHVVELGRGQLAFAMRFAATKFQWSEARVRRFLIRLKSDAMVEVQSTRESTQVTVCNYDKYAFGRRTDEAPIDAQTDEPPTNRRRKEEELKNLKTKEDIQAVAKPTRPRLSLEFEEFWKAYPRRDGANPREPARKKFEAFVKSGTPASEITASAKRYATEIRSKGQEKTPYVAQAVTWLNQQRWGDYTELVMSENVAAANGMVRVMMDTPQWTAWVKFRGGSMPSDKGGGWWCPSEYPPATGRQAAREAAE